MNFLVYKNTSEGLRQVSARGLLGMGAAAVVLLVATFTAGWLVASAETNQRIAAAEAEIRQEPIAEWQKSLHKLQLELAAERRSLNIERNSSRHQLSALATRMAKVQAQVMRIEALGSRVADVARLQGDEFDFSVVPAVGGPDDSLETDGDELDDIAVIAQLQEMDQAIALRQQQLLALEQMLLTRQVEDEAEIKGRPIVSGWLSSAYGKRIDPFHGRVRMHNGLDFAGREGSDIVAMGAGIVTWAGDRSGYGSTVEINHPNGYVTRYAHLKSVDVQNGQRVEAGEVIAKMGQSGRSTGPHLHFEVLRDGRPVNPTAFISSAR